MYVGLRPNNAMCQLSIVLLCNRSFLMKIEYSKVVVEVVTSKRKLQKENFSEDAAKCNCKVDVHSACLSRCISTFLKDMMK